MTFDSEPSRFSESTPRMIPLPDVLAAAGEVQSFCQQHGWRFCFIGGVAVQRWGEPRLTQDVDLTLLTGFGKEDLDR
jgi:hypothetical protein